MADELSTHQGAFVFGLINLDILLVVVVGFGLYAFQPLCGGTATELAETRVRLSKVSHQLEAYAAFQAPSRLPERLDELVDPPGGEAGYVKPDDLEDAWGNRLRYETPGQHAYVLRSAGPDGVFGSEDDLIKRGE